MEKKSKKKKIIVISCIIALIIAIILIWWFFFRKIEVVLDYNNGMKDETILVRINTTIDKDKIDEKKLGEKFIGWFKVVEVKDKKEVLDKNRFDFNTKIKKKLKLNAVYTGEDSKTITVKFDSMGGTEVDDIILKEGEELKLPENPTKEGYVFSTWKDKNEVPIGDGALLAEDITLYAYWDGEKKEEEKKEDKPKQENKPQPKPESISLSLSRSIGHAEGYNTGKASASVENPSGEVKYSSNSSCVNINEKTGEFEVVSMHGRSGSFQTCINKGTTVLITATLPSGKKASKEFIVEPKLKLYEGDEELYGDDCREFFGKGLRSNINVTWTVKVNCAEGYTFNVEKTATTVKTNASCSKPGTYSIQKVPNFTAVSAGGQKREACYYMKIN